MTGAVSFEELNSIGAVYQELVAKARPEQYETAVNLTEESARLLNAYTDGGRHDPVFRYPEVDLGMLQQLGAFEDSIGGVRSPWLDPLKQTVRYMAQTFTDSKQHTAESITRRTVAQYGPISPDMLELALSELRIKPAPVEARLDITAESAAQIVRTALGLVSLTDWRASVESRMNAVMDVSAERRELRIRAGAMFSRTSVARLLVHEVGCHVFRSASGSQQPLRLLGFGLGDYLPTEEGLACYQEDLTGLSDPADSRRLALRYVAAALSLQAPLFDVYAELRRYTGHDQAFETAVRAKRGIADSSAPGSHHKDKVYFEGTRDIALHLAARPQDMAVLYTGKISLAMIPRISQGIADGLLSAPKFDQNRIGTLLQALPAEQL